MITLVKFHYNKAKNASRNNYLVTKTMGKVGVLDWEKVKKHKRLPKDEEFWFVEIVKERGAGTSQGLFILNPIEKVNNILVNGEEKPEIIRMIPGTYKSIRKGNTILLYPKFVWHPKKLGPNWICGLTIRRAIKKQYQEEGEYPINTVIVVMDNTEDWPKETGYAE